MKPKSKEELDEMFESIKQLITNPPPEVIERMSKRLSELNRLYYNQDGVCLMHKRCGPGY